MSKQTAAVKEFIRHPYAWPGGYPIFAITTDGACLCHACAKANAKQIIRSTRDQSRDGWAVNACDINWEDPDLFCDHCDATIESAYGDN